MEENLWYMLSFSFFFLFFFFSKKKKKKNNNINSKNNDRGIKRLMTRPSYTTKGSEVFERGKKKESRRAHGQVRPMDGRRGS